MTRARVDQVLMLVGIAATLIGAAFALHAGIESILFMQNIEHVFGLWSDEPIKFRYDCVVNSLYFTLIGAVLTASSHSEKYVRSLKHLLIHDLKKLIAAMVLSGGTVYIDKPSYKYAVRFYGKDLILHDIFSKLLKRTHGIDACGGNFGTSNSYLTQIYSKNLVEDLLSLSPVYNTRNRSEKLGLEPESAHPTATFLIEADDLIAMESIRLMMSSNGSVQYAVEHKPNGHNFFIKPKLTFGCLSPPSLLDDYSKLLGRIGVNTFKVFDRRFNNKGFLMSSSWNSLELFSKTGGFVEEVEISSGRYEGVKRNSLVNGLLLFYNREENDFSSKETAHLTMEKYVSSFK